MGARARYWRASLRALPAAMGARAFPQACSTSLGFLGPDLLGRENPRFWRLEKLGFPWILSSESSVFNELQGIFTRKNFALPFTPWGGCAPRAAAFLGFEKHRIGHRNQLTLVSDFLQ
jgi:hypothetical protein